MQARLLKTKLTLLATVVVLVLFSSVLPAVAQPNPQINYQGKLTDASGVAVADGTYNMRFWLLQSTSQATTSAVWTESLTSTNQVQVTNGLFSVMLGSTSALTSVDFNQSLYLGVEIGGTGGSPTWDGEMSPRKILGTVPAAFESFKLGGVASTSFLRSDQDDTASGLVTFTSGLLSNASSTIVGLSFDTATGTRFVLGSDSITDFTGAGLVNTGGELSVSSSSLNLDLEGLTDVNSMTENYGDLLYWDGSAWADIATTSLGIVTTDDDLTNNSIEDLQDVAAMTEDLGDLLSWNGSAWADVATTSLGLGNGTFLGLSDTPSSYTTAAIPFVSGSALAFDSEFVYDGTNLGLGTASPGAMLDIFGTSNGLRLSYDGSNYSELSVDSSGLLSITSTGGNGSVLNIGSGLAEDLAITFDGSGADWYAGLDDTDDLFKIGTGGTVGSSTLFQISSATTTLNTAAVINGDLSATGTITFTDLTGGLLTTNSAGVLSTTTVASSSLAAGNWSNGYILQASTTATGGFDWVATSTLGITTTDDDLTNNSIEDLSDVAAMTEDLGDLLSWNGSAWADVATTSLGLGNGTFLGLSDTPSSYTASRIMYTNSGGTALTDSANFVFDGTRLGIGSTTPSATLTVSGNTWLDSNVISFASSSASALLLQYFTEATSTIKDNSAFAFTIATSTGTSPIFRIDTSGAYASTLVDGSFTVNNGAIAYDASTNQTSIENLTLGNTTFGDDAGIINWTDMGITGSASAGDQMSYTAQLDGNSLFTVYGEADGSGGLQNSGIGIGSTTPWARLAVTGDATDSIKPLFTVASSTGSSLFHITYDGKVGIGTTSPTSKLSVAGDTYIGGTLTNTGAVTFGSLTNGLLTTNSAGVLSTTTVASSSLAAGNWSNGLILQASTTATGGFDWVATSTLGITTTDDDLTNNSIEDLSDVAAMTEDLGDLLSWNGSAWADVATSALKIAISDTTGTLAATRGGTGLSTTTANQLLIGGAGDTWTQIATSSLGLGNGTFLGLSDTPSSYTTAAIPFVSGSALAFDSEFVYDGTNLGLGTASPGAMLDIFGTSNGLRLSYDGSNYTELSVDSSGLLTINSTGGSGSGYTLGSGLAEDAFMVFDGDTTDYHIGLDDTDDLFKIGTGSTVGSSTLFQVSSATTTLNTAAVINGDLSATGTVTFTDLTGGLLTTNSAGVLSTTTVASSSLAAGNWSNGYILQASTTATGGFDWVATSTLGITTTDDDLTNNSIEDLSDVAAMTEDLGDLLSWNGSAWADVATSALKIAISDTTGTLAATRGGTGLSTTTANQLLIGGAGDTWTQIATSSLGLGNGTFLGLSDTPSSYTTAAIPFVSGSALAFDSEFVYDGTNLGLGTASPGAMLDIFGTSNGLRLSYDGSNYTELSVDSSGDLTISSSGGTGSVVTLGSGLAEDVAFLLDGNSTDWYAGLDDTDDLFKIGTGSTVGSSTLFQISSATTTFDTALYASTTSASPALTIIQSGVGDLLNLFDGSTEVFSVLDGGNVGIGTTSPNAKLSLQSTGFSGDGVIGLDQYLQTTNSVDGAVQYGNRFFIDATSTATTTLVGSMFRLDDDTTFGNTVRGLEVQANRGTNTQGENTALSGFARTFGVRGFTSGDAGAVYEPAGGFFETGGTTQGNALRGYSSSITTATLLSLFQASSTFDGTGLEMNFGNTTGSFSSTTSKFLDFQNAGTSVFSVGAFGTTTIGDGTTNHMAGLQIGYGGICVDNDGTCIASTTGRITAVETQTGNSDLAEVYFSSTALEPGELVVLSGGLSVERASRESTTPVLGVVSTKPGLTLGFDDISLEENEKGFPIALSGRVPVKLSTENGAIMKGDELMLSSVPGVAMKATGISATIGIALEDFNETRRYSDTYLNQFGDDMVEPNYEPIFTNFDLRIHDGCYYSGGGAVGEAPCVPLVATTSDGQVAEANALAEQESIEEQLEALRDTASQTETLTSGAVVQVGQIVMFVDKSYRWLDATQAASLGVLTSTTSVQVAGANATETIFDRLVDLANRFVDGVLSVLTLKAERVETSELCVDGVCVDAAQLQQLLNSTAEQNAPAPSSDEEEPTPETTPTPSDGGEESTYDLEPDSTPSIESESPTNPEVVPAVGSTEEVADEPASEETTVDEAQTIESTSVLESPTEETESVM